MKAIAGRLRAARVATGLSQSQAARRLKIPTTTLAGYEQGTEIPLTILRDLSEAYGPAGDPGFILLGPSDTAQPSQRLPVDRILIAPEEAMKDRTFLQAWTLVTALWKRKKTGPDAAAKWQSLLTLLVALAPDVQPEPGEPASGNP